MSRPIASSLLLLTLIAAAASAYAATPVHLLSQRFGGAVNDNGYSVATDGSGNVFVTGFFGGTVDFGGGSLVGDGRDIFVAKYSPTGTHLWSRRFGSAFSDYGNSVATDTAGNVFVTGFFDGTVDFGGGNLASAGSSDIFIAKYAGNAAEPLITSIADIGNDQGRKVKIRFERSGNDHPESPGPVTRYVAFRRDDSPPANVPQTGRGTLLETGWTQVGWVDAFTNQDYGIDVPTIADSTITLGQYHSFFFIRAATDLPATYYDSAPDSGYSLDNLAPGVPGGLQYATGALAWDESNAEDFDYFTVYGSNTDSFGAATLVDYSVAAALDVTASPYVFYFVTATDFAGNEGRPAKVNTLSGVGGTPRSYVLSVTNYPNPFNPGTTVNYTVPARGQVRVSIYDVRGERITTLVEKEHAAGAYSVPWDGRAADGSAVSSGVYFARVEHESGTRAKKMVLLK